MLETMTMICLQILPWSYVAKTAALGLMWWKLDRQTIPTGPLGERINTSFFRQFVMSAILIALTTFISIKVDPEDIEWPVMTIVLAAATVYPYIAAWGHYQVWRTYRLIARERES